VRAPETGAAPADPPRRTEGLPSDAVMRTKGGRCPGPPALPAAVRQADHDRMTTTDETTSERTSALERGARRLRRYHDDYLRWLYRGGRPNRFAQMQNRASALVFAAGIRPRRLATLEVPGRRSGRVISFPVVIADLDGERYLVAMLGEDASWPLNVRAADGRAVLRHGHREIVRLEEVDPAARPPIIRRYLAVAPGARPHIAVDRHAPVEEFVPIAPRIPVFRITPDES